MQIASGGVMGYKEKTSFCKMKERMAMELCTDKMIARKEDGVGWLIFNNPARRNAVSMAMWEAVGQAMDNFQADDDIRVVVMMGAGDKAFVSGADISEFAENRNSAAADSTVSVAVLGAWKVDGGQRGARIDVPLPPAPTFGKWCESTGE